MGTHCPLPGPFQELDGVTLPHSPPWAAHAPRSLRGPLSSPTTSSGPLERAEPSVKLSCSAWGPRALGAVMVYLHPLSLGQTFSSDFCIHP